MRSSAGVRTSRIAVVGAPRTGLTVLAAWPAIAPAGKKPTVDGVSATGQGVGGVWYVAAPDGTEVKAPAKKAATY